MRRRRTRACRHTRTRARKTQRTAGAPPVCRRTRAAATRARHAAPPPHCRRIAAAAWCVRATHRLEADAEVNLGRHLLRLGEVVREVERDLLPSKLCEYIFELSGKFNREPRRASLGPHVPRAGAAATFPRAPATCAPTGRRLVRTAPPLPHARVARARCAEFYESCPVLNAESAELQRSRLALCGATASVLRLSLGLLGIEPLERL